MIGDHPARHSKAWIVSSPDSVFLISKHFSSAPPKLPYKKFIFLDFTFAFYPVPGPCIQTA
jgi:hypothetical protein